MSVFGDSSDWDTFFEQDLIPAILELVLTTWDRMEKPAPDALENVLSKRLYSALVNAKDRSLHTFLIRYEDVEVDIELVKETGRKDIVFFPATEEDIYFCLECKRLNAMVAGESKSLADEYVKNGMQRFVQGQYAKAVRHGGMLGYVLDGNIARAIGNVENCLQLHLKTLGMDPPGRFQPSSIRPRDPCVRETAHRRRHDTVPFQIHHLFLAGPSPSVPKPGR